MINLIKVNLSQVHVISDVFFSGIPFSTLEKKCTAKLPLVYLVTQLAQKKATIVLENKQKIAWKLLF